MITHVKVIAWLHIILGGLGILMAISLLLFFGGIAGIVSATEQAPDAQIAVPILGGIGGLLFVVLTVLSLPSVIVGVGLVRFAPWARIVGIVISALDLVNVPLGTALGIYGLWALTKPETEALFSGPPPYQPATY